MTPKKKPTDVIISGVDEGVQEDHDKILRANAWKERVWTAAVLSLIATFQVVALAWVDGRSSHRSKVVGDKVEEISETVDIVAESVEEVHKSTNSMKDQLVKEVREAAFAKGQKKERDDHGSGTEKAEVIKDE